MRITLVPSFVMAVLLGFSGAVVANTAPASPAPVVSEAVISPEAQVVTINLTPLMKQPCSVNCWASGLPKPRQSWLTVKPTVISRRRMS